MEKQKEPYDKILFSCLFLALHGDGELSEEESIVLVEIAVSLYGEKGATMLERTIHKFIEMGIEERIAVVRMTGKLISSLKPEVNNKIAMMLAKLAGAANEFTETEEEILKWLGMKIEYSDNTDDKEEDQVQQNGDKPENKEVEQINNDGIEKDQFKPFQHVELSSIEEFINIHKNDFSVSEFKNAKKIILDIHKKITEKFPEIVFRYSPSMGATLYANKSGKSKFAGLAFHKKAVSLTLLRDFRNDYRKPVIEGIESMNIRNNERFIDFYKLVISSTADFEKNIDSIFLLIKESKEVKEEYHDKILKVNKIKNNQKLIEKYLDNKYTYVVKVDKAENDVHKDVEVQTEESEDEIGYPFLTVKIFKPQEINDRRIQYTQKWVDATSFYNGATGIRANIPKWVDQFDNDNCCPEWSSEVIDNISENIEKRKIIPVLGYIPKIFFEHVKQIWWICPFVIINDEFASLLFINKNGLYALMPEDEDITQIVGWGNIYNSDLDESFEYEDCCDENLAVLELILQNNDRIQISEFVKKGRGSYLKVLCSIYEVYRPIIEASLDLPIWQHGAGNESYIGYNSVKELEDGLSESIKKGYPNLEIKVLDEESINNRRKQYTSKWILTSFFFNLQKVKVNIPNWLSQLDNDNCCPEWSEVVLEKIALNIEKKKIIPVLSYLPKVLFEHVEQVWWICPLVIFADNDTALVKFYNSSLLFVANNGLYSLLNQDDKIEWYFGWDQVKNIDFIKSWNDENNLVCLEIVDLDDQKYRIIEFVKQGKGSYLQVLYSIYKVYRPVIEASAGKTKLQTYAGNESYEGYNSVMELESGLGK